MNDLIYRIKANPVKSVIMAIIITILSILSMGLILIVFILIIAHIRREELVDQHKSELSQLDHDIKSESDKEVKIKEYEIKIAKSNEKILSLKKQLKDAKAKSGLIGYKSTSDKLLSAKFDHEILVNKLKYIKGGWPWQD